MSGTNTRVMTKPRVDFDQDVTEKLDENGGELDPTGWYAVATDSFPCPASGCSFVARHMTAAHRIIVWPEKDDAALLALAGDAKRLGRNPRIVEYEASMGPCLSYDQWRAIGMPVHALIDRPEGWPNRA